MPKTTLYMGYRPTEKRIRKELAQIIKEGKVKFIRIERNSSYKLGDHIEWEYEE